MHLSPLAQVDTKAKPIADRRSTKSSQVEEHMESHCGYQMALREAAESEARRQVSLKVARGRAPTVTVSRSFVPSFPRCRR